MNTQSNPPSARAAVFHAPGQPLTLERFPLPELKGGEALARIRCATICGSDLHSFHGATGAGAERAGTRDGGRIGGHWTRRGVRFSRATPVTRRSGNVVHGLELRRLFLLPPRASPEMRALAQVRPRGDHAGSGVVWRTGGVLSFAGENGNFRLPPELPDLVTSPANCATATVASGVVRYAGHLSGCHVVIHGAGMLGLTACAMAAANGASSVITLEPGQERREKAWRLARRTFRQRFARCGTVRKGAATAGGRGADMALEFSGNRTRWSLG